MFSALQADVKMPCFYDVLRTAIASLFGHVEAHIPNIPQCYKMLEKSHHSPDWRIRCLRKVFLCPQTASWQI